MDGTKRRRCLSWHSCVVGGGAAEVGRREGRVGVEEGPVRPVRQRPCALVLCEGMRIFCVSKMRQKPGRSSPFLGASCIILHLVPGLNDKN